MRTSSVSSVATMTAVISVTVSIIMAVVVVTIHFRFSLELFLHLGNLEFPIVIISNEHWFQHELIDVYKYSWLAYVQCPSIAKKVFFCFLVIILFLFYN